MIVHTSISNLSNSWNTNLSKNSLQAPFYTFSWHEAFFKTLGKKETPYIIDLPEYQLHAPFIRSGSTLFFSGGKEVSDYMDIIGPEHHKAVAWQYIIEQAKKDEITELDLHNIPGSSSTLDFFRLLQQQHKTINIEEEDTTPSMSLPENFELYTEHLPKKQRHELERKRRKFEREHPGTETKIIENKKEGMNILIRLMRKNEQKRMFLMENEAFFQALPLYFPNTTVFTTLYIKDNPIAITLGFKEKETFYLYNTGFDFNAYPGAGFYIQSETIKYAIEQKYSIYNFLQGNERYKYELGAQDSFVFHISAILP